MTLQKHKVEDTTRANNGKQPCKVPSGWEIAPGDAVDLRVCSEHAWQCDWLVFSDGFVYSTSIGGLPHIGNSARAACSFWPDTRAVTRPVQVTKLAEVALLFRMTKAFMHQRIVSMCCCVSASLYDAHESMPTTGIVWL